MLRDHLLLVLREELVRHRSTIQSRFLRLLLEAYRALSKVLHRLPDTFLDHILLRRLGREEPTPLKESNQVQLSDAHQILRQNVLPHIIRDGEYLFDEFLDLFVLLNLGQVVAKLVPLCLKDFQFRVEVDEACLHPLIDHVDFFVISDHIVSNQANLGQVLHEWPQNLNTLLLLDGNHGRGGQGQALSRVILGHEARPLFGLTHRSHAPGPDLTDTQHDEFRLEQLIIVKQPGREIDVQSEVNLA